MEKKFYFCLELERIIKKFGLIALFILFNVDKKKQSAYIMRQVLNAKRLEETPIWI